VSLGRKWTLRADGIKVLRWKVFSLHRQSEGPDESYRGWSGYRKAGVCATCKSPEFLFHRRNDDLMKPVVPSTVPYPDMRSR
jgi:hypothetical protein